MGGNGVPLPIHAREKSPESTSLTSLDLKSVKTSTLKKRTTNHQDLWTNKTSTGKKKGFGHLSSSYLGCAATTITTLSHQITGPQHLWSWQTIFSKSFQASPEAPPVQIIIKEMAKHSNHPLVRASFRLSLSHPYPYHTYGSRIQVSNHLCKVQQFWIP